MPSNSTPKKQYELTISTLRKLGQKDGEKVVGGTVGREPATRTGCTCIPACKMTIED